MFSISSGENISDSVIYKSKGNLREAFEKEFFFVRGDNKEEILKELDLYNINEATLFPELEHQLSYIKYVNSRNVQDVVCFAKYDTLTKPQAIKDLYENDELIAITKELADTLRKNKTIDWQKRDSARAQMRMLIKRLLKKHKYPPEGMEDAVATVMTQCELWTDNVIDIEQ